MQLEFIGIILGIVIYLHTVQFAFGGIICPWSKYTSHKVASCPESQSEMEARANEKNCESIAQTQNCTMPEKIKYHCVMNELENAFIEVCAPEYRIHGYCTEYNEIGTVIQAHHNLNCESVKPSCDSSYLSTEAFRYKGCYDKVRNNIQTPSTKLTLSVPSTPEFYSFQGLVINGVQCNQFPPLLHLLTLLYIVNCI